MMSDFEPDSAVVAAIVASPNHGARESRSPDTIILHYTGMSSGEAALKRLCDAAAEVSCHYLIWENGHVTQLVPEARRAWHAGRAYWAGERDVNSISIGIEIVNPGHEAGAPPFPDAQIEAVIALCRDIIARHKILPQRVLAHSDVAPFRKADPGEAFPWERLAKAGIGHYVAPVPIGDDKPLQKGSGGEKVEGLQGMLAIYGYDTGVTGLYGKKTGELVMAFQRHFRPERVDGKADYSTFATLQALLAALPKAPRK